MNLTELAEVVAEVVERPDYTLDSPLFRSMLQRAINQAHALAWFERDLKEVLEPVLTSQVSTTILLPEDYRAVNSVSLLDSSGELLEKDFIRGQLHRKPSSYFGNEKSNYYLTLGNEFRVFWKYHQTQASVSLQYYAVPSFEVDQDSGDWVSDSWILKNFSDVIIYEAARNIGTITDSSQEQRLKNLAEESAFGMFNDQVVR